MSNIDPIELPPLGASQADPPGNIYEGVPNTRIVRDPETGELVEVPFQTEHRVAGRTRNPGIGQAGMVTEEDPYSIFRDPAYLSGSEQAIYAMPAPVLAALQRRMVQAGLLDEGDYNPGYVGVGDSDPTLVGFNTLLAYTNRAGFQSYEHALRRLSSIPQTPNEIRARADEERARLREERAANRLPQVSDPAELRRVFRAAVINELGVGWSERQIDDLVAAYQSREMQYGAYGRADPVPGVAESNVAPPSPQEFAANAARAFDPEAATGQDFLGTANTFFQLLSGGTPAGELPGT